VPLQTSLAQHDALNDYISHTGSAIFACPPGARGGYVGEGLLAGHKACANAGPRTHDSSVSPHARRSSSAGRRRTRPFRRSARRQGVPTDRTRWRGNP
jgi:hypothetical protein